MNAPPVRTRFAPSPTGYMHIGGMRTALFNWLFARHHGGRFILRIDDTDRQRNVEEALAPILRAFRWLGLAWDEGPEVGGPCGPYFQSERTRLYRDAADRLLTAGKAFKDFDPPELVKQDREEAEKRKQNYVNIRRSLNLTESQIRQHEEEGKPFVVRFLVPRQDVVMIDDAVRGHVKWDCSGIPDPVILRGDGSPLYNFATVVDDGLMRISHVIRAEEHLSNTPVQVLMHQALGNTLPQFAHIPFVSAPGTKEKLSKRDSAIKKYRKNPQFQRLFDLADERLPHVGQAFQPDRDGGELGNRDPSPVRLESLTYETLNPVMVEFYEQIGYLPEAVLNALSRLGWSLDDKTEILSLQTVVENFTLDRVIKSPAGLDPDKLDSYQLHWMGTLSVEQKVEGCLPFLRRAGSVSDRRSEVGGQRSEEDREFLGQLISVLGDRLKIFSDIIDYPEYFVADDALEYDETAFKKRLTDAPESVALLRKCRDVLAGVEPFDATTTETSLKDFVESQAAKLGDVIHALRVAVTGKPQGPGMFDCLALLGKESCVRRIDRALARA